MPHLKTVPVAYVSGSILIATSRSSFVSVARYTSPIPPTPIWAAIRGGCQESGPSESRLIIGGPLS